MSGVKGSLEAKKDEEKKDGGGAVGLATGASGNDKKGSNDKKDGSDMGGSDEKGKYDKKDGNLKFVDDKGGNSRDESSVEIVDQDLLEQLTIKNDSYRNIVFKVRGEIDKNKGSSGTSETYQAYQTRVSFDTIDLQVARDIFSLEDDEDDGRGQWRNNSMDMQRGRDRMRSPSPSQMEFLNNPSSPSRRVSSPLRNSVDLSIFYMPPRIKYPTKPIITHRGCTFTKLHKQFEDLYEHKLNTSEFGFRKPVLPRRVIMVYVNGRRHTWVALDWVLNKFVENGDSIVITSSIKSELMARRSTTNYRNSRGSRSGALSKSNNSKPEYVKHLARNIMQYALEVINPDIITKITVELAVGETKQVLREMYKLYEPNLVSTGTKLNPKISAPLRSWRSSKISDRLVKNSHSPVILVPAMNMNDFEQLLAQEIEDRYCVNVGSHKKAHEKPKNKSDKPEPVASKVPKHAEVFEDEERRNNTGPLSSEVSDASSIESEDSLSSQSSEASELSSSSYDEIADLFREYKDSLQNQLQGASEKTMDENYYSNFLKIISDESAFFCRDVASVNPDFKGKGAKLARAITGSNSFGVSPYKTKSLLQPIEKLKTDDTASSSNSNLSYKEIKKRLEATSLKLQTDTPKITINEASAQNSPVVEAPRTSSLKFVDTDKPSAKQDDASKKSKSLTKCLSHDTYSHTKRPLIQPTKSHPDILSSLNEAKKHNQKAEKSDRSSKKSSRKKKRFLGLF